MECVKQELRRQLQVLLRSVKGQHRSKRRRIIRTGLSKIQRYCHSINKTFIFCELEITCADYNLGGSPDNKATLFRGPNEDASVAICITEKGSLLHRNDGPWTIYHNAGDVLLGVESSTGNHSRGSASDGSLSSTPQAA